MADGERRLSARLEHETHFRRASGSDEAHSSLSSHTPHIEVRYSKELRKSYFYNRATKGSGWTVRDAAAARPNTHISAPGAPRALPPPGSPGGPPARPPSSPAHARESAVAPPPPVLPPPGSPGGPPTHPPSSPAHARAGAGAGGAHHHQRQQNVAPVEERRASFGEHTAIIFGDLARADAVARHSKLPHAPPSHPHPDDIKHVPAQAHTHSEGVMATVHAE